MQNMLVVSGHSNLNNSAANKTIWGESEAMADMVKRSKEHADRVVELVNSL
ncbi:MAG: hypothetical protein ACOYJC_09880 [Christensenellales bacterium]|jgi:hypothetical protein